MTVITFSSLKGGTGKSSTTLLVGKCFAASGLKVLIIDTDINNSVTFSLLDNDSETARKNIAYALQGDTLLDFVVHTESGIDLIPSSLNLVDLRALALNRLKQLMPTLGGTYDVVLLDTAPTYDNIVLNAINASDYVITPINYDQFNFNTSIFLSQKLRLETDKFESWYLFFNGHESRYDHQPATLQNQYRTLFLSNAVIGQKILNIAFPRTSGVKKFIDTDGSISTAKATQALHQAVCELCSQLIGKKICPERF